MNTNIAPRTGYVLQWRCHSNQFWTPVIHPVEEIEDLEKTKALRKLILAGDTDQLTKDRRFDVAWLANMIKNPDGPVTEVRIVKVTTEVIDDLGEPEVPTS